MSAMKSYLAIIHHEEGRAFGISFPDLPGCFAASDEEADLFEAARTALALYAEDQDELPEPRRIDEISKDAEIAADIRRGAILISVPLIVASHKKRVNLALDPALLNAIDATARSSAMSRSEFVAHSVARRLEHEVGAVYLKRSARETRSARAIESTGKGAASAAARVMKSKTATKAEKAVAASALTQKGSTENTSKAVASKAAKVLKDPKASKDAKSAAASALTQKKK